MLESELTHNARRYFDLAPDDMPPPAMLEITKLLVSDDEREWARGMDQCAKLMSLRSRNCPRCGRPPQ